MFSSVESLLAAAREKPLWEAVWEDDRRDRSVDGRDAWDRMTALWRAMNEAVDTYDPCRRSPSGMVGGAGARITALSDPLCGEFLREVMAGALKTGECNACMGRIVAAPTAGASGVLPAVLIPLSRRYGLTEEDAVRALFVAAGFGQVIAPRASISGAEGGCQAEIGSAAAMAAAAAVHVRGGSPQQMAQAMAIALQNLMGLVCDPVAGLVEVPCVARNVIGAADALTAADLALAGITTPIPPDEVIDAMGAVGESLPASLRETGQGGLAATPTGRRIAGERAQSSDPLGPEPDGSRADRAEKR